MNEGASSSKVMRQDEAIRRKRRNETLYRRRRMRFAVGFAVVCLVVAGVVIAVTADGFHRAGELPGTCWSAATRRRPRRSRPTDASHPAFARLDDRNLLLPVAAGDATIIAYQPVSDRPGGRVLPHRRPGQLQRAGQVLPGSLLRGAVGALLPAVGPGRQRANGAILVGRRAGCPVTSRRSRER